jgi:hypothetical protein
MAKASKHLRATAVLIEHELPEDAIVLSRAVYECYVSAAYAEAHGIKAVDDLVYNPVGLTAGKVEYARTKAGRPDYRRLVDLRTDVSYNAPPSIERMVLSTGYPPDAMVHRYYYGFSSQHAHVNMAGSGNYRDGAAYTDRGDEQRPNAVFLTGYVTAIILGLAIRATDMDGQEKSRIKKELRVAIRRINSVLDMSLEALSAEFVDSVRARLNGVLG